MSLAPDVEAALDRCFDAVVHPSEWRPALDNLAMKLGALGCGFNVQTTHRSLNVPASSRYGDMLKDFVGGGWLEHDLRRSRGWPKVRAGASLVFESDISTADERKRSPLYNEVFARHEMDAFVGIGVRLENQAWGFNLARASRTGWFNKEAAALLALRPSIRRLLLFAQQVGASAADGMLAAFEEAALAALLLDHRGRVTEANRTARMLMGAGLDIHKGRVVAGHASSNAELEALIGRAVLGVLGDLGAPVCIRRERGGPLIVEAIPLNEARADPFHHGGALLLIRDLHALPEPDGEALARTYGLTRRERDVALLLGEGLSVPEIGERLALRASSVRQLVKAVLAKTGSSRQSAVAVKIARLPASSARRRGRR